ncbi:MAG: hypothetical protein K8M05_01265, partial [Deltaproteobacteria bacterium]|nr:hypothetical protein [Kofleriaceae bacterium]
AAASASSKPSAARGGLALAMIDWVLARARAAGVNELRSGVVSTNRGSLALHRAAGFTETGTKQAYDLTAV